MLLSLLLGLAVVQPSEPPHSAQVQEEIVVVGEKLKNWRGRVRPGGQTLRCVTERSTRDPEIDRIGCDTMVICITPMRGRIEAASDRRRPRSERRALEAAYSRDLTACFTKEHDRRIADLAERRYQARQGK